MHTPEQARELWCPMVRIARREVKHPAAKRETTYTVTHTPESVEVVGGCNTDAFGGYRVPATCRCIADQCAMWRWTDIERDDGYCGIAGRPEVAR